MPRGIELQITTSGIKKKSKTASASVRISRTTHTNACTYDEEAQRLTANEKRCPLSEEKLSARKFVWADTFC